MGTIIREVAVLAVQQVAEHVGEEGGIPPLPEGGDWADWLWWILGTAVVVLGAYMAKRKKK